MNKLLFLIFIIFLVPILSFAQAPTDDSTKLVAPPIVNSMSFSSLYQRGGNASNYQFGWLYGTKWIQGVTGYQFNHYVGTATAAAIAASGTYTAGYGLNLATKQFSVDTTNIVTKIWANRYLTQASATSLYARINNPIFTGTVTVPTLALPGNTFQYVRGDGTLATYNGGTVTSVGLSVPSAFTVSNSPITSSGTIDITGSGNVNQYIRGDGSLATYNGGTVTSVGLSMPSAFTVTNSPITSNGTIGVTGAGTATQYIRGDGQLATFPSTGAGGSSVYYYLNGSINASVATYKQMANVAVIGAGTDFNLTGNGLIAQFLTDVANPNRLEIPGGAWNFEMFFNMSSSGGTPQFYVELLKYDGAVFTSIASNVVLPETISAGTATDLYLTSLAVPTTTLLLTDRLVIRVYIVNNSGGRTATLHTEDNSLCQITTTFSGGISAINGLTSNNQYLAVGTSGSDFNISSTSETHTFNLPTASAANRGALSSADWSTFNGKESALSFTSPLSRSTNTISIPVSTASVNGYLSSSDWTIFNGKQAALSGTGYVKFSGTTPSYVSSIPNTDLANSTISGVSLGGTLFGHSAGYGISGSLFNGSATQTWTADTTSAGGLLSKTRASANYATLSGLSLRELSSNKGIADGYASLDGSAKVPLSQIPDALLGAVNYQGSYNASTNVPALPTAASGNKGYYWVVSTAGTQFGLTLAIGDWIISNGSIYQKIDNNNAVTSVNSQTGAVVLTTSNIAEGSNLYYTDTRARAALSGTAPIGYNSTTGAISITQAATAANGYLSSTDWNTFNGKQAAINGTGFVKATGTTISYDNTSYLPLTGGTLSGALNGTTATFSGSVTAGGTSQIASATLSVLESATNPTGIAIKNRNANQQWNIGVDAAAVDDKYFAITDQTNSFVSFKIAASTGAATFSGGVTAASARFASGASSLPTSLGQVSLNNQIGIGTDPINYATNSSTFGQAILNSYYASNLNYPRYLDIASIGSPDGTNGAGIIRFLTNPVTLNSPAVEQMRISSSGATFSGNLYAANNVGIGTTSPDSYGGRSSLSVNGTNGGIITLQLGGTKVSEIYAASGGLTQFTTTGSFGFAGGAATFSGSVQFGSSAGYTTATQGAFFSKGGGNIYTADILAAAAVTKAFVIQRNDGEKFSIGLDGSDNLAFINSSGTSVASIANSGNATFSGTIDAYVGNSTNGNGVTIHAINSGGTGSQPGVQYNNHANVKRFSAYLDVSSDTYNVNNNAGTVLLSITQAGNATISSLAGSGSRMVVASSTGVLSATATAIGNLGYVAPTTGTGINLGKNGTTIINPAGALAALDLVLPSSPADGDFVRYTLTESVSSLTYSGGTIVKPPTIITGRTEISHAYRAATASWY